MRPTERLRAAGLAGAALLLSACASSRGAWSPEATVLDLRRPIAAEWLAIYLERSKLGALETSVTRELRGGAPVLVTRSTISMMASAGSGVVRSTEHEERVYEARTDGRLVSFSLRASGHQGDLSVDGQCTRDGCVAQVTTPQGRTERRLPPVDERVEMADVERLVAARRAPVSGLKLNVRSLEVSRVTFAFAGTEVIRSGDGEVEVAVVEDRASGRLPVRSSFAPDGRLLRLEMGQVVARAEPREMAVSRQGAPIDLASATRVQVPMELASAREVPGQVTFELLGVPTGFRFSDHRQTWKWRDAGPAQVMVTARRPVASDPAHDAARGTPVSAADAHLLASTVDMDADSPAIREAARVMVGASTGAYQASLAILGALTSRFPMTETSTTSRASDALEASRLNCDERARLFVALARAAGVPARQIHGLRYHRYGDGVPALYWRPWVEVRSGTEWIAMDPELGQGVADATHLALGKGESSDEIGLVGGIKALSVTVAP
jgi:hypothetical protein